MLLSSFSWKQFVIDIYTEHIIPNTSTPILTLKELRILGVALSNNLSGRLNYLMYANQQAK